MRGTTIVQQQQHQQQQQQQQQPSEQEIERFASPLLSCLHKHYLDQEITTKDTAMTPGIGFSDLQSNLPDEIGGGFVAAVSLHDTNTLFVSSGITRSLGYQQDMLIGQSLLGYLYPRDRLTFVSFLSQGLQARFSTSEATDKFVFYVRIREYKGLKSGFDVAGAKSVCKPFQLKCSIKDITMDQSQTDDMKTAVVQTICFIIIAIPLVSAHKLSRERNPAMVPFCTRHTPSCHFSHIDPAGLPFLGYFPQDIIGYPIFDFYHQDDLKLIREVYDIIVKQEGSSFFSKPYRFRIFNGDFITLETEWSCFINPWSKKFEFIVGQHRIIQGPVNIDVFTETEKTNKKTNDQLMMKKAEEEISFLLAQPVKRVLLHQNDQRILQEKSCKRKRTLAAHVSKLIESGKQNGTTDGNAQNDAHSSKEGSIWSDKESVLIGVISPHRENSEDLQDQRLQDNIERFFASQPKTICPTSSTGSSSQNQSPYGSGSNDGSSSNNNKSSNDSAFQSGSCGEGLTRDGKMDESNNEPEANSNSNSNSKSSEHGVTRSTELLTEEMLAQHDRICQRQMRKGQSQSLKLHPKSTQAKDDAACINNNNSNNNKNSKNKASGDAKSKKRGDGTSRKNEITTLDEMFKNSSFAVQPPFALGFAPYVMGSGSCHSCGNRSDLQQQLQQKQQHQHQQQHVLMPVLCTVPICSSTISFASSSQQSSSQGKGQAVKAGGGGGVTKNVRVQTESIMSPVRHMSPFEREDCQVMRCNFQHREKDLRQAHVTGRSRDADADDGNGSKGETEMTVEGRSSASTSFASSSSGEESSSGRDVPAEDVLSPRGDNTLDQILLMEQPPIKSEVPAPWITEAQEYSDEVIFRFRVKDDPSCKSAAIIDAALEHQHQHQQQPDFVRQQFTLLRKEKATSTDIAAGPEFGSESEFTVSSNSYPAASN